MVVVQNGDDDGAKIMMMARNGDDDGAKIMMMARNGGGAKIKVVQTLQVVINKKSSFVFVSDNQDPFQ